eukprot:6197622-Pleurochrysis_carterae.AAC.1
MQHLRHAHANWHHRAHRLRRCARLGEACVARPRPRAGGRKYVQRASMCVDPVAFLAPDGCEGVRLETQRFHIARAGSTKKGDGNGKKRKYKPDLRSSVYEHRHRDGSTARFGRIISALGTHARTLGPAVSLGIRACGGLCVWLALDRRRRGCEGVLGDRPGVARFLTAERWTTYLTNPISCNTTRRAQGANGSRASETSRWNCCHSNSNDENNSLKCTSSATT